MDRHHQTTVIVTRDDGAIPVLHPSDLIDLFTAAQLNQVNPFVQEIFADPEASENVITVESAGSRSTSTAVPDYPRSSLGDYLNDEVLVATAALRAADNENAASNDTVVHEDVENEATPLFFQRQRHLCQNERRRKSWRQAFRLLPLTIPPQQPQRTSRSLFILAILELFLVSLLMVSEHCSGVSCQSGPEGTTGGTHWSTIEVIE